MKEAHIEIEAIGQLVMKMMSRVPATAKRGSPRQRESLVLRSTSGGGGRARATMLDELSGECHPMTSLLVLVAGGVADCLDVARRRNNEVNWPVLSIVLRPVMEIAGQIAWLLDDTIDGAARGRRYLVWQFDDLTRRRKLVHEFRDKSNPAPAVEIEQQEKELLAQCDVARWQGIATSIRGNGRFKPASLLDGNGKREEMPSITDMVRLVSSSPSLYDMLCVPTHGSRLAARFDLTLGDADRAGRRTVQMGGFGLPPNLVIGLTALALMSVARHIGGWNGIDIAQILQRGHALVELAGVGG